ncbi:MAG TPA: histidinol-phosphate transaminase [Methylothermaceae bacterium]|nr:histidinol-phosphate transaminase [Methylothermaceae bacterium]
MTPDQFFRPDILAASAYHVPAFKGPIKLDAMENPYAWPPEMVDAWLEHLRRAHPNRYPDPQAADLKACLRRFAAIPDNAELLLGNGSDEIILILLMALVGQGDARVMAPEPTFVMYREIARWLDLPFVGVPLKADFSLDPQAMLAAIERHNPRILFIAYPNNPTGNLFDAGLIEEIIARTPGLVVVDEAYAPFARTSFMDRLGDFDNLLIMRTLSKLGLAGLRLGYLVGAADWLSQFDKMRLPYNINVLTQLSAEFALSHGEVFQRQAEEICQQREELAKALAQLPGVEVFPSAANFLLFRVPDAGTVFERLKARGILIKNLDPAGGLLRNCLRVTVGTPAENQRFLTALRTILVS